jgi:hypothetical protein
MMGFCHLFLALCATAFATKAVERFETPHWISLIPESVGGQIREWQDSTTRASGEACQKEREEHWDLQMKVSDFAERGGSGPEYVEAADKAEAAATREQACRHALMHAPPLTFSFDLYSDPTESSKKLGQLKIEVRPWIYESDDDDESGGGAEVKTSYIDQKNRATPFTADVPHPFNEKPAAFQTVMAKAGMWYQLPPRPFPQAVWMNFSSHGATAPLSILKITRPVFVKLGDTGTYVIFRERRGHKLIGIESTEDRSEAKPAPKGKVVELDLSELFDPDGHVRARWRGDDED